MKSDPGGSPAGASAASAAGTAVSAAATAADGGSADRGIAVAISAPVRADAVAAASAILGGETVAAPATATPARNLRRFTFLGASIVDSLVLLRRRDRRRVRQAS